jgi:hypothetical protein
LFGVVVVVVAMLTRRRVVVALVVLVVYTPVLVVAAVIVVLVEKGRKRAQRAPETIPSGRTASMIMITCGRGHGDSEVVAGE